ncbi:receptor-transporting protein 3-like [Arapaima gigas]
MGPEWIKIFDKKMEQLERGDTWTMVTDDTIMVDKLPEGWQQYICKTNGRFKCSKCKNTWPSQRVMVLFFMYLSQSTHRGTVKVRCFRQECRRCADPIFEEPRLRKENVDRLLEKLIEKIRIKCYKEDTGVKQKPFVFDGRVDGPHEARHCQACHYGICRQARGTPEGLVSEQAKG